MTVAKSFLPWGVISHDIIIEVPEDVSWRFWRMRDHTSEVDGRASINMKIRISLDPNMGH